MSRPHHHHLVERMAQKGWSQQDLQDAYDIFEAKKDKPHFWLNSLELPLHWFLFLMVIFGNMVVVAALLPLLVVYPNTALYAVVMVLGLCFGFLVELVIKHIDHLLGSHHHFILAVILPAIAIITSIVIMQIGSTTLPSLIPDARRPVFIGVLYGIAFVLPYLVTKGMQIVHQK